MQNHSEKMLKRLATLRAKYGIVNCLVTGNNTTVYDKTASIKAQIGLKAMHSTALPAFKKWQAKQAKAQGKVFKQAKASKQAKVKQASKQAKVKQAQFNIPIPEYCLQDALQVIRQAKASEVSESVYMLSMGKARNNALVKAIKFVLSENGLNFHNPESVIYNAIRKAQETEE